jgi:hypothetical protein
MQEGNLAEVGRQKTERGLGEHGSLGEALVLYDRRENPSETIDLPGFDIGCSYADTEICGRCGAC